MPLILGTNSIKDTGYEVANSCRFSGGNDYLRTTGFGTPTSSRKMTLSFWCKRSGFSGNDRILVADTNDSNNNRDAINFSVGALVLFLDNAVPGHLKTNRLFRDPSAWYHIVIAIDTTQSTSSDRIKIYVNGVQETSFDSSGDGIVYPSQNYDILGFGQNRENTIGADSTNGGSNDFFDGYLAEYCFIDGQQLDPTSFGEFDEDTGIWKPIDVSGLTFGTNGFYLDFENSGSLGADVSGNGNNFTVNNLTSVDQSTDTCTNNFATMNPLVPTSSLNFSNGNLTLTGTNASNYSSNNTSNFGVSSGKWYVEVKYTTAGSNVYPTVGISPISISPTTNPTGALSDVVQVTMENIMYYEGSNTGSYLGSTPSAGNIIQIALDMDNGKVFFGLNGTFVGDPVAGTGGAFSGITSGETICFSSRILDNVFEFNFGNPPFTISSGNTDGNGYGNFEYSVPSGYYSLNTKNLAEYG